MSVQRLSNPGYANRTDFCKVLEQELKPLYLLAFLLTAEHQKAEQCLVATIEEAMGEQAAFKNWVRSWIKRTLIKHAIRIIGPGSARRNEKRDLTDLWSEGQYETARDGEINALTQLPPLERFVFILSVLERYSDWDCYLLLGRSTQKVKQSRMQALRRLPGAVERFPRLAARASRLVEIPA